MAFRKPFWFSMVIVLGLLYAVQCNGTLNFEEGEKGENQLIFKKESHWKRIDAEAGQITVVPSFRENSRSVPQLHNYEANFIDMDSYSLMLPQYMDAHWYMYTYEGKGRIGWVNNQKLIEQDLETGQVYFVPKGSVFYLINTDKTQRFRLINLLHNEHPSSPERHHESYYVGGGQDPLTVFSGFRRETLAAGFGMDIREVEKVLRKQKRGAIVSMGKEQLNDQFLSWLWASKKHQGSSEGPEKPFNLLNMKPDFSNDNGKYIKADCGSYPPLGIQDLAIGFTRHERGGMTAPHWSSRTTAVSIVLVGRGRVEIVIPEGETVTRKKRSESEREVEPYRRVEGEITVGDVFIVPAGHPAAEISYYNESFNILTFLINNERNNLNMLTGKNSVMTEIKDDVLAVSMNEKQQALKKVFEAQKDELFVRGPREAQRWNIFCGIQFVCMLVDWLEGRNVLRIRTNAK